MDCERRLWLADESSLPLGRRLIETEEAESALFQISHALHQAGLGVPPEFQVFGGAQFNYNQLISQTVEELDEIASTKEPVEDPDPTITLQ